MVFHLRMRLRRLRAARGRARRLNGLWTSCLMLSNRGEFKQKAYMGHFAFFFPVVERDFSPVDTWNYPAAPPDGVHLNNS